MLEETPSAPSLDQRHLLPLSAETAEALRGLCLRLADFLDSHPEIPIAALAHTLQTQRITGLYRCAITAETLPEACRNLRSSQATLTRAVQQDLPVAFLFPGQGSQFPGMGAQLYQTEGAFRETVDRASEILYPLLGADLKAILWEWSAEKLQATRFSQPALLVISYALSQVWQARGVIPQSMLGHSVGEYAAAVLAGVFSFEEALRLVTQRALLIQKLPPGAMLAVRRSAAEIVETLPENLDLAALNSSRLTVVAGSVSDIEAYAVTLRRGGIAHKRLLTSHAFHSRLLEPVREDFRKCIDQVRLCPPSMPYISNVSGDWITADQATDPDYWTEHVLRPVSFAPGLKRLTAGGPLVFLECGPGRALASFVRQTCPDTHCFSSLPETGFPGMSSLLGKLWSVGARIPWPSPQARRHALVDLPSSLWTSPVESVFHENGHERGGESIRGLLSTPASRPEHPATDPQASAHLLHVHDRRGRIFDETRQKLALLSEMPEEELEPHTPFLDLGFDSLLLGQAASVLSRHFQIKITFRRLMEDLDRLAALVDHIDGALMGSGLAEAQATGPLSVTQASVDSPQEITFPLTESQQEVFLGCQLASDASCAFNEALGVDLLGPLDRTRLLNALNLLIDAHEALRTVFTPDGRMQIVKRADQLPSPIKVIDLSSAPQHLAQAEWNAHGEPFDVVAGPLIRIRLFQLGPEKHRLLIVAHHLVMDGWSFDVIYRQLARAYAGEKSIPATPFRTFTESPAGRPDAKSEAYWLKQFEQLPDPLRLPADRDLGPLGYRAGAVHRRSEPNFVSRLQDACRRYGVTPYVLMLAAYRELLARLSGQNDFVIGTPMAGQASSGFEALCGHCVSFLPWRMCRRPDETVMSLLADLRTQLLDAVDHQHYTLGQLTKKRCYHRAGDHRGLAAVSFTLEPLRQPYSFEGIETALHPRPKPFLIFDLSVFVVAGTDAYTITANFSRDKCKPATIRRWLSHYFVLLDSFLGADAEDPVANLEWLSSEERRDLVHALNKPSLALSQESPDVVSLFETQVARTPDAPALLGDSLELSYLHLNRAANALARQLVSLRVQAGDHVAILARRSPETIVAMLAVLKAGAVYVPLANDTPRERLLSLLHEIRLRALLTQRSIRDRLPSINPDIPILEIDAAAQAPPPGGTHNLANRPSPEDAACIIFTSGSTGQPKGVRLPHRGITRLAIDPNYLSVSPSDVFLQSSSVAFDASLFEIWVPLLNGATVAVPPPQLLSVESLGRSLEEFGVTTLFLTTGLFHLIMEERPSILASLRQLLTGGDIVDPSHLQTALAQLPEVILYNVYGPTESTTFATFHRVTTVDCRRASIPIGKPVNGTSAYVLDANLNPSPLGVPGELYLGGRGLALDYLNHPEKTREKFIPSPFDPAERIYATGDRCRYLSNGALEFIGRTDRQVKLRGFRIELDEIEGILTSHAQVSDARVLLHGQAAEDKWLSAYVAVPEGSPADFATILKTFLEDRLPPYMVPATLTVLHRLPLTANGKVDDAQLSKIRATSSTPSSSENMSATPTEERLKVIWMDILNVEHIGRHDNFFDLGGHSLLGLRLFTRLQNEFAFRAPLATLFASPTLASLARRIEEACPQPVTDHLALIARIKVEGSRPPLICIHGGDGGILFYRNLAAKLPSSQPLWAVESPALADPSFDFTEFHIESTVDRYLSLIRTAQPAGPYLLGGYSFGGLMAYALAARLRAEGETVENVILIDAANPAHQLAGRYTLGQRLKATWDMQPENSVLSRLGKVTERISRGVVRKAVHRRLIEQLERRNREGSLDDTASRMILLNEIHERAALAYSPPPYPGPVLLLRTPTANDRVALEPDLGWSSLVPNLTVIEVPGTHLKLFQEPYLTSLAAALTRELERGLTDPPSSSVNPPRQQAQVRNPVNTSQRSG